MVPTTVSACNDLCGARPALHTLHFMRQPWLTMLLVGGLLGLGCGKTVYRSHEAQFCSTDPDDDPFYECSPSSDLVCIQTYSQIVQSTNDSGLTSVPLYLCRLACEPLKDRCPNSEICCPGMISGKTYGKTGGCVPESRCDKPIVPDGGFDLRPDGVGSATEVGVGGDRTMDSPTDSPVDAPSEAGAADAGVDAATDMGL